MTGFDLAQARYDGATPDVRELTDEAETDCLGFYEQTDTDDAFECDQRTTCYLCGGVVCKEHDDTDDCDGEVVHDLCHREGCASASCAEDAREAALLARGEDDRLWRDD